MKHDCASFMPKPTKVTAASKLAIAFEHYNEKHPHSALKNRSPRELRRSVDSATLCDAVSGITRSTPGDNFREEFVAYFVERGIACVCTKA